jgi:hypothetical protein
MRASVGLTIVLLTDTWSALYDILQIAEFCTVKLSFYILFCAVKWSFMPQSVSAYEDIIKMNSVNNLAT